MVLRHAVVTPACWAGVGVVGEPTEALLRELLGGGDQVLHAASQIRSDGSALRMAAPRDSAVFSMMAVCIELSHDRLPEQKPVKDRNIAVVVHRAAAGAATLGAHHLR